MATGQAKSAATASRCANEATGEDAKWQQREILLHSAAEQRRDQRPIRSVQRAAARRAWLCHWLRQSKSRVSQLSLVAVCDNMISRNVEGHGHSGVTWMEGDSRRRFRHYRSHNDAEQTSQKRNDYNFLSKIVVQRYTEARLHISMLSSVVIHRVLIPRTYTCTASPVCAIVSGKSLALSQRDKIECEWSTGESCWLYTNKPISNEHH